MGEGGGRGRGKGEGEGRGGRVRGSSRLLIVPTWVTVRPNFAAIEARDCGEMETTITFFPLSSA